MPSIENLGGMALILAICALLFVEELGVPLPFAPGDIVLAIGGIAVAGGRVNPVLLVGLTLVAIIVGAALGREVTALLGWDRLMKIARPLHADKPLGRAAQLLRRGGWRTVFTARLLPGLRVYTTQMAGVTGVRRSTFLAGLVPSAVVYVAGFVGLGAAFGRPILALIHASQHQVLLGVLALAVAIALVLLIRIGMRCKQSLVERFAKNLLQRIRLAYDFSVAARSSGQQKIENRFGKCATNRGPRK